jgi:predicted small lipoprotein YifL
MTRRAASAGGRHGRLLRLATLILMSGLLIGSLNACGKKGNPVPPEDAPPAKQETK